MTKCEAVRNGAVQSKGHASAEFYVDGKPRYYCYGIVDKMTDALIPECRRCQLHVSRAQDDLDAIREEAAHD